ncbi:MAG: hypothetical protein ACREMA_12720 [Longimicrobiales bacterium]
MRVCRVVPGAAQKFGGQSALADLQKCFNCVFNTLLAARAQIGTAAGIGGFQQRLPCFNIV